MYFGTISSVHMFINWTENGIELDLNGLDTLYQEKIIFDARVDEAITHIKEGSDRYKLWQISNYISKKITYSTQTDIVSVLNGKGVCTGYAMLFYKMASRIGIQSYLCYGCDGDICHAWNMVYIDGEYKYYDITWFDGKNR
jgi:transglutaminase/protease-like cytokinesis protein 3